MAKGFALCHWLLSIGYWPLGAVAVLAAANSSISVPSPEQLDAANLRLISRAAREGDDDVAAAIG
jgi:hypothetical protein